MRTTCSIYVDAGYLLASAATRVTGTSLRNGIHVEFSKLVAALIAEAEERAGMPVLRVHWYDSARNGVPDVVQERIGELSKVKLRLGRFGVDGAQKGVDVKVALDLVAHARNAASDVFFLVSGDDDLAEAVEEAQVHGVQVVVLGVPGPDDKPHGVSRHLIRAADELALLPGSLIDSVVMRVEVPKAVQPTPAEQRPVPTPIRPAPQAPTALRPTPGDLAQPRRATVAAAPRSALAYTGTTGGSSHVMPGYDEVDVEQYSEQIDDVIKRVLTSYRLSASEGDWLLLMRGKPSIPRDVDRALLVDVSDTIGIEDLPESIRFRIRARFWELAE